MTALISAALAGNTWRAWRRSAFVAGLAASLCLGRTFFPQLLLANGSLRAAFGKIDISPIPSQDSNRLAGYGVFGRKTKGVHDPLYARAVLVSDGKKRVALVGVDSIGMFREDVLEIRRRTGWDGKSRFLFLASTHDHSSPDMMGLWGKYPGDYGVDARYRLRLIKAVSGLILDLSRRLEPVHVRASRDSVPPEGFCRDSRDPAVIDSEMVAVEFLAGRSRRPLGTVVRWSCHATVMGFNNRLATAEYPGALCSRIEARTGGGCLFLNGLIGGHLVPDIERTWSVEGDFGVMKRMGDRLADIAIEGLRDNGEEIKPGNLAWRSRVVRVPVENSIYRLFLANLSRGHQILNPRGNPLSAAETHRLPWRYMIRGTWPADKLPWIETEISMIDIGAIKILGVPGEMFPELALGGYDGKYRFGQPLIRGGNSNPPQLRKAPRGPYLRERMNAKYGLIVGMANDEIGYIVPAYDFKANPDRVMAPRPKGDHYEETLSLGVRATELLMKAYDDLLGGKK